MLADVGVPSASRIKRKIPSASRIKKRMDQYCKMKLNILEKVLFLSKTTLLFPIKIIQHFNEIY
jgi:hypothetical protein